jgi:small-conductance mechanosensitive channel
MSPAKEGAVEETIQRWLFDPIVGKIVTAAVALTVLYLAVHFLHRSIGRYIADGDARYRARKITSFLGYLVGIGVLAIVFSDRLTGLTVAFGVAGAGIAFALQEIIASIAGWVAVSFGNFFRPGDRVQLGGIKGDVIDIGMLRTTVMELGEWVNGDLYNGRIVRIANSFVFKEPVFNYSADFPFLWDEVTLRLKHGSDWKLAKTMIEKILDEVVGEYTTQSKNAWKDVVRKYRIEDARVEPTVTLQATENWIEFTGRYIVDYQRRRITKDSIFTRLLEEVDKSDGRIALAVSSLELVAAPALDVRLSGGPVPAN